MLGVLMLGSIVFQAEAAEVLVSMEIRRPTCDLTFSGLDNGAGNYTYPMGNLTRPLEAVRAVLTGWGGMKWGPLA